MDKKVYIHTFGCQMNVHDSEKMLGILEKKGYSATDNPAHADLVIFNTCSIRQKAEQKFYSELGRMKSLKKRNPDLRIAVAGCIAQQAGKAILKRAPYADFIIGPQNLHTLAGISDMNYPLVALDENPVLATEDLPASRRDSLKAWVTIMYGCNNFCSYCVVPHTRGRERSRPSENIRAEICNLAKKGCKEITLLGQNVNSYRSDVDFSGLLRMLNEVPGIERIRFITSHPKDLSPDLAYVISDTPKVCEHIHLPLQSGADAILNAMNRKYRYADYRERVRHLRERVGGIAITSDIIAGFPGETDGDHARTLSALRETGFDGIFAFKFSPRPFTKAEQMEGQLSEEIKSYRLKEILELQDEITLKKNRALEGTFEEILVDGESETDPGMISGRTRSNKIVNIPAGTAEAGRLIKVEIVRGYRHSLTGRPIP